ncbi:MAG: cadherin-like beta sandwich domain-containing protein [Candidatus Nomurabacteria bacterium]|nr:cadherin-like beta sandwich domain-containing protein [Candidatus Nomurabacteria bacterium]
MFDPNTLNYDLKVFSSVAYVDPIVTTADSGATVEMSGRFLSGANPTITITVSGDGLDDTVYTLNVTKNFTAVANYTYSGVPQVLTVNMPTEYTIQLWGAAGGTSASGTAPGRGAYTSGTTVLQPGNYYIYVGQTGIAQGVASNPAWNGGGAPGTPYSTYGKGGAGGGATDFRLVNGAWNDANGLRSRVMVAAGGGGSGSLGSCAAAAGIGGFGGALSGGGTTPCTAGLAPAVGTQTGGYAFGVGQNAGNGVNGSNNAQGKGGGGGGYWGGGAVTSTATNSNASGAGGSSYISGYTGAVAVASAASNSPRTNSTGGACANGTTDNVCSQHWSGVIFNSPVMMAGNNASMPNPAGGVMTGSGSGYARVTAITPPSNNNFLTDLRVNGTTVSGFNPETFEYYTTVSDPLNAKLTLAVTKSDPNATMIGDGEVLVPVGTTRFAIEVTAENGEIREYAVNVTRTAVSSEARLASLSINGTLIDGFDSDTFMYNLSAPLAVWSETAEIEAVAMQPFADVDGAGEVTVDFGYTAIMILVTAEDGATSELYTLYLTRDLPIITPSSGLIFGGNRVEISARGIGKSSATIEIGGKPCTNVIIVSDDVVSCIAPTGNAAGFVDLVVSD